MAQSTAPMLLVTGISFGNQWLGNGTNWGPWTTYTSGAYSGKC